MQSMFKSRTPEIEKSVKDHDDQVAFAVKEYLKENKLDYNEINKNVQSIKKMTSVPILVGFGIKSKKDVINISKKTKADGVIIGSAIIQKYFDLKMNFDKYLKTLNKFIKEVKV